MVDEKDISLEQRWLGEERAKVTIKNLQKRNINARCFASRKEALNAVLEMIPQGATVARGDSITVDRIGIIPELIRGNQHTVIDPFQWDEDGYYIDTAEDREQMQREAFFADVFLSGINAITMDGKLVNVDGLGNRVAAIIYRPRKVILVAGVNKIVKDVDEAMARIRQVAAPMNARRHYLKHHYDEMEDLPCVKTGRCLDCTHDWKICCFTVIIDGAALTEKGRLNVVLVGEELGL
jgi:hypothetical protein